MVFWKNCFKTLQINEKGCFYPEKSKKSFGVVQNSVKM